MSFVFYAIHFVELSRVDCQALHLFYEVSDIDFLVLLGKQFIAVISENII